MLSVGGLIRIAKVIRVITARRVVEMSLFDLLVGAKWIRYEIVNKEPQLPLENLTVVACENNSAAGTLYLLECGEGLHLLTVVNKAINLGLITRMGLVSIPADVTEYPTAYSVRMLEGFKITMRKTVERKPFKDYLGGEPCKHQKRIM